MTFPVTLFEFDERFAAHGSDFFFYDYKNPVRFPPEMGGLFDIVVADPPFLSEECLTKTALTIRFLSKHKVLLCTGEFYSSAFIQKFYFYLNRSHNGRVGRAAAASEAAQIHSGAPK